MEERRDEPSCWSTPIVVEYNGVHQLITNGHNRVRSYDLESGDLIWECGGQVSNVTPSPVCDGESVCCMSGYRGSSAMALPLDAKGDISESDKIRWQLGKNTPYVPSPVLYDDLLFFNQTNRAVLTCVDVKSGETLISPKHMDGLKGLYASPLELQTVSTLWTGRNDSRVRKRQHVQYSGQEYSGRTHRCIASTGGKRTVSA